MSNHGDNFSVSAPQKMSMQFFRFTVADWYMVVVLSCGVIIATTVLGSPGTLLATVTSVWLMWIPSVYGRYYYVYGMKLYNLWIMLVLKDKIWEDFERIILEGGTLIGKPKKHRLKIFGFIKRNPPFPLKVDSAGQVGLIYNTVAGTYSILVGSNGSNIVGMSSEDQHRHNEMIAHTIREVGSYPGLDAQIGWVVRRRPAKSIELDVSNDKNAYPNYVVPEALVIMKEHGIVTADELLEKKMITSDQLHEERMRIGDEMYKKGLLTKDQLRDYRMHITVKDSKAVALETGNDVQMVAVVTIKREYRLKTAASGQKPLHEHEIDNLQVVQLAEEICEGLQRAGVDSPVIYTPQECEQYLREAIDVVDIEAYRKERIEFDTSSRELAPEYGPRYGMYVTDNSCVIDQTGHATVLVTGLPKSLGPNTLPLLFTHRVRWLSRSLVSETSSGNMEYNVLGGLGAIIDNVLDGIGTVRTGPKTRHRRQAIDERQEELSQQQHAEYFRILLCASNEDPAQLERDVIQIFRAVQMIGGKAERVKGRSNQISAMLSATTGIPVL